MARETTEIYDALIVEKDTQSTLTGLQPAADTAQDLLSDVATPSRVADWRLIFWIVATGIQKLEGLWDLFKAEIEEIAANAIPGTVRWYKKIALEFQLGYALVYIDNKFQYSTIDVSAQIIQRAAVIEVGGQVKIKVAKLVSGVVTPLTSGELSSFDAYIQQVKYAGVNTAVISRSADLLKIAYTVYYDPLVLDATGALISDSGVFPVEDAINNFISNLPFNGELVLTELTDAVQLAEGVDNPVLTLAEARYGILPFATINVKYLADAGHMAIDSGFPLSTQITYIANV